MKLNQDEYVCHSDEEIVLYSFPAFDSSANDTTNGDEKWPPLVLELVPLPLLSEDFEQMPVGARGWYASAVLSAMMLLSCSSSGGVGVEVGVGIDKNDSTNTNIESSSSSRNVSKGIDLLREDLQRACASPTSTHTSSNNVFLELGSGTIGLAGMTMTWIVAQHRHNIKQKQSLSHPKNKVVFTDYDHDCLKQLERNAIGVRRKFREYFSTLLGGDNDDDDDNANGVDNSDKDLINDDGIIPEIEVLHLDWNEYDKDQSPILPENNSNSNDVDVDVDDDVDVDVNDHYNISFICGAALVYMEATAACADQVAKMLRLNPNAVVWVVQWPRDGWFNIFQQELLSTRYRRNEDLKIDVQKFGPMSSPELFSNEVRQLAQTLMPETMQQESQMNIKDLRAIRITNTKKKGL